jgi:hypothetical protein
MFRNEIRLKIKIMKYIAFRGTYNEQIYDTETMKITWTNCPDIFVPCSENVKPILSQKTWEILMVNKTKKS